MSYRVLLAAPDPELIAEFTALAGESGEFTVVRAVPTAGELMGLLDTPDLDVIVIHEELGPLPVFDLARELIALLPEVGLVLLARNQSAELLASALQAGFRGVARLPLSLEDVQTTIGRAGVWTQALRSRLEGAEDDELTSLGKMVAIAGAKGGVGTTVVTVCLALMAALSEPRRKVCLVDFDLQTGDVRSYLNLTHRRSVADLVEVAHDLSAQQLHDALSIHTSGVRVLLPPPEGEQGETITSEAARRILGGIRSRFDLVIVDCGAVMSEGSSVAVEMADQAVVVVTPDVPAMRAANRLLTLWERLQVRKDGIGILVNRASRDSEIQPELVAKIVSAPMCKTAIPSDFRALEGAANTGVPGRLEPGPISRAILKLARELRLVRESTRRLPALRSQSGQVAVETMGMTFIIGVVVMLLWEIVLVGFTFVLSGHAAREAARQLAVGVEGLETSVVEDLPPGWDGGASVESGEDWVEVTLNVPALVPGVHSPFRISTHAGTHREARAP